MCFRRPLHPCPASPCPAATPAPARRRRRRARPPRRPAATTRPGSRAFDAAALHARRGRDRWRSADRPPLYGVPSPSRTTSTSPACRPPRPARRSRYSPAARRRRACAGSLDAGAIAVGKTNLDQFATGLNGTRSPVRRAGERLRRRPDLRRVELGQRGGRRGGRRRLRAGHRHRRLRAGARGAERDRRAQADPRAGQHGRGRARLPLAGLRQRVRPRPSPTPPPCSPCSPGPTRTTRGRAPARTAASRPGRPAPGSRWPTGSTSPATPRWPPRSPRSPTAPRPRRRRRVHVPVDAAGRGRRPALHGPWVAERLAGLEDFLAEHPDDVLPVTRAVIETRPRVRPPSPPSAPGTACRSCGRGPSGCGSAPTCCCCRPIPTTFTRAQLAAEPVAHNLVLGRYTQFANLLDLAAVAVPAGTTRGRAPVRRHPARPGVRRGPPDRRRQRVDHPS